LELRADPGKNIPRGKILTPEELDVKKIPRVTGLTLTVNYGRRQQHRRLLVLPQKAIQKETKWEEVRLKTLRATD
ncbi:MAG TPA: hypothetical protein VLX11_07535, partial [Candidatus Acidoferrales bacterium]|nr:hypothetical protein [Candidatus Acidoferrales bacterium]